MIFTVRPDIVHPDIRNDGMQYDGMRFRAECSLAGKIYGRPFGIDAAFGEPMFGEPDLMVAEDVLGFAGIIPTTLRVYPVETHIAEKLHAYTMPRLRPNSRIKDLPDLALIATAGPMDANRLRAAIDQTFAFRGTHDVPDHLPEPPKSWIEPYAAIAKEDRLRWTTITDVYVASRRFLDPVLTGIRDSIWDPETWDWSEPVSPKKH
jgi:hypothetical protein